MNNKPKILITGGLGNLGSWLLSHFSNLDWEIYVLAKNKRNLTEKTNHKLILCDIANTFEVEMKLQPYEFDYVVHLASYNTISANHYEKDAVAINALGTRNLLQVLSDKKLTHFLYFSTFQVYGKYEGNIDENTVPTPANDYGITHLFAEEYVKMFGRNHKIPFTIVRPTNGYGAPKDLNSSKWNLVLNDLAKTAYLTQKIELKSNGKAPRDFIWLGTVCEIIEKLLEKEASNTTYNLSSQKTHTILDIAQKVQSVYEKKYKKMLPISVNDADKTKYSDNLIIKSDKIRNFINIKSADKFEQEIERIFELLEKQ